MLSFTSTPPRKHDTDASENCNTECPGCNGLCGLDDPLATVGEPEGAHHLAFLAALGAAKAKGSANAESASNFSIASLALGSIRGLTVYS